MSIQDINKRYLSFNPLPMQHFTPDEFKPSEITLSILRTIARNYPTTTMTDAQRQQCWN